MPAAAAAAVPALYWTMTHNASYWGQVLVRTVAHAYPSTVSRPNLQGGE